MATLTDVQARPYTLETTRPPAVLALENVVLADTLASVAELRNVLLAVTLLMDD
jgi:hypothetical protein